MDSGQQAVSRFHAGGLGGTYGGSPVACAAALAVIETMRAQDLCGAARRIEALVKPALEDLARRYPVFGEGRGRGAMLALEFVEPGTKSPDPTITGRIHAAWHARSLVTLTAGSYGNVIRLLPPLVIGDDLLVEGLGVLAVAFAAVVGAA